MMTGFMTKMTFSDIYNIYDIHDIYSDDYTNNGGDKS